MARRESFDKVARRVMAGTVFKNAELYRVIPSTGIGEYVRIKNGEVVEFTREPHDDEQIQQEAREQAKKTVKRDKYNKSLKEQNGLEYRGTVMIAGSPVDFYGSEKAWKKFLEVENEVVT